MISSIGDVIVHRRWIFWCRSQFTRDLRQNGFAPESNKGHGASSILGCRYPVVNPSQPLCGNIHEIFLIGRGKKS